MCNIERSLYDIINFRFCTYTKPLFARRLQLQINMPSSLAVFLFISRSSVFECAAVRLAMKYIFFFYSIKLFMHIYCCVAADRSFIRLRVHFYQFKKKIVFHFLQFEIVFFFYYFVKMLNGMPNSTVLSLCRIYTHFFHMKLIFSFKTNLSLPFQAGNFKSALDVP